MEEGMINNLEGFIMDIVENKFNKLARSKKIYQGQACEVVTYTVLTDSATLHIPPDMTTETAVSYANLTGVTLVAGNKVELIYRYGDIDQGFIMFQY